MNIRGSADYAGALFALAMLCSCGASTVAPSNATPQGEYVGTSAVTVVAARALRAMSRYATVLPDKRPKSKHYEYIIDDYGTYAGVFDYPEGTKATSYIHNVGGQGCTNVLYGYGKGTFWIVAGENQISEYAVPHKLIESLSESIGAPSSCAMDIAGDLAVGILDGLDAGDVIIYKNALRSGTQYSTGLSREFFDGYDSKGDLFADGVVINTFQLVELPAGSSKFETISTSNAVSFPGSVQWDGTYLDVTDQRTNSIYKYTISGTNATLQGTVSLSGSGDCAQTWIATGVVYCADAGNNVGEIFNYPAGGSPIATFTGKFDLPLGTVAATK